MVNSAEINITAADIEKISEKSRQREKHEHRAKAVHYDPTKKSLHILTRRGEAFAIDVELLQGVAGASDKQISNIEIVPTGEGLHWPDLDASLLVNGICTGVYGSKSWMENLSVRKN